MDKIKYCIYPWISIPHLIIGNEVTPPLPAREGHGGDFVTEFHYVVQHHSGPFISHLHLTHIDSALAAELTYAKNLKTLHSSPSLYNDNEQCSDNALAPYIDNEQYSRPQLDPNNALARDIFSII